MARKNKTINVICKIQVSPTNVNICGDDCKFLRYYIGSGQCDLFDVGVRSNNGNEYKRCKRCINAKEV